MVRTHEVIIVLIPQPMTRIGGLIIQGMSHLNTSSSWLVIERAVTKIGQQYVK